MKNFVTEMSAFAISEAVRKREISASEVCGAFIDKIERDRLNAFITTTFEEALSIAGKIDLMIESGDDGDLVLAGVPVAVKDNICVDSLRATCASKMLCDFVPSYSATSYEKLVSIGAVLVGKTNLDEFAMGSENTHSYYGRVKNPYDESRVAGGSSGGSAAAVAAGYAPVAFGTDTGGSARLPASLCGIVAMKPTYGRVSRFGLISFAPSFEQICPMTRTVFDNALVLEKISGRDARDMTTFETRGSFTNKIDAGVSNLTFGIYAPDSCERYITEAILHAARILDSCGAKTDIVELDSPEEAAAAYMTLSSAEASSTLSRYDGIRYGYSNGKVVSSRTEGFGSKVKERIAAGAFALLDSGGDYYKSALCKSQRIKDETDGIFNKADVLIMPVSDKAAWRPGENENNCFTDRFTVYANLTGCPSICIPAGRTPEGLPFGIGLMGAKFSEDVLYRAAYVLEKEIGFFSENAGCFAGGVRNDI